MATESESEEKVRIPIKEAKFEQSSVAEEKTTGLEGRSESRQVTHAADNSAEKLPIKEEQTSCVVCDNSFQTGVPCAEHQQTHSNNNQDASPDTLSSSQTSSSQISSDGALFKCGICSETFSLQSKLRKHRLIHLDMNSNSCRVCGKACGTKADLKKHSRIHNKENPFSCDFCGEAFKTRRRLLKHQTSSHSKESNDGSDSSKTQKRKYVCTYCGKISRQKIHHVEHERIHTNEKPFDCKKCGKAFTSKRQLTRHAATHIGNRKKFPCSKCSIFFPTYYSLAKHRQLHKDRPHVCSVCKKMFTTANKMQKHLQKHQKQEHICGTCNKRFPSLVRLTKHKEKHKAMELIYKCLSCNRCFKKATSLQRHQRSSHKTNRKNSCKFCQKSFKKLSGLNLHLSTHAKAKKIGQSARSSSNLKSAMDKYSCGICSNFFETYYRMRQHKQMHQERPFMCDTCEETFMTETALGQHKLSVCIDPFVCEECQKTFPSLKTLQRHRIKHVMERPYLCGVCLKSFKSTNQLKAHMFNHLNGKSHACPFCGKDFTELESLQEHRQICEKNRDSGTALGKQSQTADGDNDFGLDDTFDGVDEGVVEISCREVFSPGPSAEMRDDGCGVSQPLLQSASLRSADQFLGLSTPMLQLKLVIDKIQLLTCDICQKAFQTQLCLDHHKLSHKEENPEQNPGEIVCPRIAESSTIQPESDGTTTCFFCKDNFQHYSKLLEHKCPCIQEKFGETEATTSSVATAFMSEVMPEILPCVSAVEESNETVLGEIHIKTATEVKGQGVSCGAQGASPNLESPSVVRCTVCKKTFSSVAQLKKHKLKHLKDRPYPCDNCETQTRNDASDVYNDADAQSSDGDNDFGLDDTFDGVDEGVVEMSCLEVFSPGPSAEMRDDGCGVSQPLLQSASLCSADQFLGLSTPMLQLKLVIDKIQLLTCDICQKAFQTQLCLDHHKLSHKEENPEQNPGEIVCPRVAESSTIQPESDGTTTCFFCKDNFQHYSKLLEHKCPCIQEKFGETEATTSSVATAFMSEVMPENLPCVSAVQESNETVLGEIHIKTGTEVKGQGVSCEAQGASPILESLSVIRCTFCKKTFPDRSSLKDHKCIHSRKRMHGFQSSLRSRVRNRHNDEKVNLKSSGKKMLECNICKKLFTEWYLARHILSHIDEQPHKCGNCKRAYKHKCHLRVHEAICKAATEPSENVDRKIRCSACNKEFKFNSNYNRHRLTEKCKSNQMRSNAAGSNGAGGSDKQPSGDIGESLSSSATGSNGTAPNSRQNASGSQTDSAFGKADNPSEVGMPCTSTTGDSKNKEVGSPVSGNSAGLVSETAVGDKVEQERTREKNLTCRFCGKVCPFHARLVEHERVHTKEKPFKCDRCSGAFAQGTSLRFHKRKIHNEICPPQRRKKSDLMLNQKDTGKNDGCRVHTCSLCPEKFPSVILLKQHKKATHVQERPFRCDECDKAYLTKAHLKEHHLWAHAKFRKFRCPVCNKGFARKKEMDRHIGTHSKNRSRSSAPHCSSNVESFKLDDANGAGDSKQTSGVIEESNSDLGAASDLGANSDLGAFKLDDATGSGDNKQTSGVIEESSSDLGAASDVEVASDVGADSDLGTSKMDDATVSGNNKQTSVVIEDSFSDLAAVADEAVAYLNLNNVGPEGVPVDKDRVDRVNIKVADTNDVMLLNSSRASDCSNLSKGSGGSDADNGTGVVLPDILRSTDAKDVTEARMQTNDNSALPSEKIVEGSPQQETDHHSTLLKHERVHTKEQPFKCGHCIRSFAQARSLRDHIIRVHKMPVPCRKRKWAGTVIATSSDEVATSSNRSDIEPLKPNESNGGDEAVMLVANPPGEMGSAGGSKAEEGSSRVDIELLTTVQSVRGDGSMVFTADITVDTLSNKAATSASGDEVEPQVTNQSIESDDKVGPALLATDDHDPEVEMLHVDLPISGDSLNPTEGTPLDTSVATDVSSGTKIRLQIGDQSAVIQTEKTTIVPTDTIEGFVTCRICSEEFPSVTLLKQHKLKSHVEKPFQCNQCQKTYLTDDRLKKHKLETHTVNTRKLKCQVCHKELTGKSEFNRHKQTHITYQAESNPDTSETNPKVSGRVSGAQPCGDLEELLSMVAGSDETGTNSSRIENDSQTTDAPVDKEAPEDQDDSRVPFVDISRDNSSDDGCDEDAGLDSDSDYEPPATDDTGDEIRSVSDTSKDDAGNNGSKVNLQSSKNSAGLSTERTKADKDKLESTGQHEYICRFCGKVFIHASQLLEHQRAHTKETPFECDRCDEKFTWRSSLRSHIKNVHNVILPRLRKKKKSSLISKKGTGDKSVPCTLCSEKFPSIRLLTCHKKQSHKEEKEFKCDECNKAYFYKNHLKEHKAMAHSGVTRYPCPICNEGFHRKANLDKHKRNHVIGLDYVPCNICDEKFPSKPLLRKHRMESHGEKKPFACDLCEKTYRAMGHLKEHKMCAHTNLRRFKCILCNQGFLRAGDLERHKESIRHSESLQNKKSCQQKDPKIDEEEAPPFLYVCVVCKKEFPFLIKLKDHENTVHNVNRHHTCLICKDTFFTLKLLRSHQLNAHTSNEAWSCKVCGKTFSTMASARHHDGIHWQKNAKPCTLCGAKHLPSLPSGRLQRATFYKRNSPWQVALQRKAHKGESKVKETKSLSRRKRNMQFQCMTCGGTFQKMSSYKTHQKIHAAGREVNFCRSCGKHFMTTRLLQRHSVMFHSGCVQKGSMGKCERCRWEFGNKTALLKHLKAFHLKQCLHSCGKCRASFQTIWRLKAHERQKHRANSLKLYVCTVCSKSFSVHYFLRKHKEIHSGKAELTCTICKAEFKTEQCLLNHRQQKHKAGGQFKCDLCGKFFSAAASLKAHQVVHSDLRPFICEHCGKRYKTNNTLRSHRKRRCFEDQKHICPFCGKSYPKNNYLAVHMRSHRDKRRSCQVCQRVFKRQCFLTEHIARVHTNTRRFPCTLCPKKFFTRQLLQEHQNCHTGAKPHKCKICGAAFAHGGTLYRHLKGVHKQKKKTGKKH